MADLQLEPKCPKCGRLTVDNNRHCPNDTARRPLFDWARSCQLITCASCKRVYGPVGYPGF